jgi:hypothetical protein
MSSPRPYPPAWPLPLAETSSSSSLPNGHDAHATQAAPAPSTTEKRNSSQDAGKQEPAQPKSDLEIGSEKGTGKRCGLTASFLRAIGLDKEEAEKQRRKQLRQIEENQNGSQKGLDPDDPVVTGKKKMEFEDYKDRQYHEKEMTALNQGKLPFNPQDEEYYQLKGMSYKERKRYKEKLKIKYHISCTFCQKSPCFPLMYWVQR